MATYGFRLKKLKYSALFPNTHVFGFEEVMENLNAEIANIANRSMKGLIMSAAHIRNQTEKVPPVTPLDLGNLRSSWFVVTAKKKEANDKWNKPFRSSKRGSKTVVNAERMKSEHDSAIQESLSRTKSAEAEGKELLIMGYSANYAVYVHEMIGMHKDPNKKYRPGSGPKWFETAVKRNSNKILEIIKENVTIKG